jgi:hypothetical protein
MSRARTIADFGDGIATADIGDGQITTAKIASDAITDALLPAGSVLQVVQGSTSTKVSTTSQSYVDTGLSADITPSSATSKILVLVNQSGLEKSNSDSQNCIAIQLLRDATAIANTTIYGLYTNSATPLTIPNANLNYLDTPATTSEITYKTQFKNELAAGTVYVQEGGSPDSTIILMEIAG